MSTINEPIVIDAKMLARFKIFRAASIAIILNCLVVLYVQFSKEVPTKEIFKDKIVYKESFVPTKVHLTREELVDLDCLALNIYHEARGETLFGKMMVGFVSKNRVASENFPNTYCEVIYQKKGKTAQFSWINDGKSDSVHDKESWYNSLEIAYDIIHKQEKDLSEGALYYHKNDKKTKFTNTHYSNIKKIGVIGKHVVFKPKD